MSDDKPIEGHNTISAAERDGAFLCWLAYTMENEPSPTGRLAAFDVFRALPIADIARWERVAEARAALSAPARDGVWAMPPAVVTGGEDSYRYGRLDGVLDAIQALRVHFKPLFAEYGGPAPAAARPSVETPAPTPEGRARDEAVALLRTMRKYVVDAAKCRVKPRLETKDDLARLDAFLKEAR